MKTHLWLEGNTFFKKLIEKGKPDDILKAKEALIEACASNNYSIAYCLCDLIITNHHNREDLLSIAMEVCLRGISSENAHLREKVFSIIWRLLYVAPKFSLPTAIECITQESKQKRPVLPILARIEELVRETRSGSQSVACVELMKKELQTYSTSLNEALTNLSSCDNSYIKLKAEKIKALLERELIEKASATSSHSFLKGPIIFPAEV